MNYQEEIQKLEEQIIYLKLKKELRELELKYGPGCSIYYNGQWVPYTVPSVMYQETNLEKAKRMYPRGTMFISLELSFNRVSTGIFRGYSCGGIYVSNQIGGFSLVFRDGQWAEIIKQ